METPPVWVAPFAKDKETGDEETGEQEIGMSLANTILRCYIVGIMRKVLVLSLVLFALSAVVSAQEKKLSNAPQSFRTFYAAFKRAVERNDKIAVANMSRFPFSYGYDAGDEGKYNRRQFIKNFKLIFHDPKDFFRERNPRFGIDSDDGRYYISTEDASHLGFVKSGRTYKFVSYIVEP